MIVVIILLFLGIGFRLFQLQVMKNEEYSVKLVASTEKIVSGEVAEWSRPGERSVGLHLINTAKPQGGEN